MENGPPDFIPEIFKNAGAISVAIVTALGVWLAAITPKFGTKKQTQIDNLQEDVKELRAFDKERKIEIKELHDTIVKQRESINKFFARDLAWTGYTWALEKQIIEGGGTVLVVKPIILTTPITMEDS
jgi:hypothetical protein